MRAELDVREALKSVEDYRNVAAIVLSLCFMQAATTSLSVVAVLALVRAGTSGAALGVVVAAYALGFLAGARYCPAIIGRVGHIRSFASLAAVAATLVLLLYVRVDPAFWTFLEAGIGACVAGLLATGESWVTDSAPPQRSGAVLGFYLIASKLGAITGPLIIAVARPSTGGGLMIVAALLAMSLVPVAATRSQEPKPPSAEPFGPLRLVQAAPAAVISAFIAGFVNGSVLQLYPVFAAHVLPQRPSAGAAVFNLAMIAGSLVVQWPAGHLSDRKDRRTVIAALALAAAAAGLGLAMIPITAPFAVVLCLAALWGAGGLSFYGVAVAHAADRAAPGQATNMMAGILMIWGTGAALGPLVAGALMQLPMGPRGLFVMAAAGMFALAGAMMQRRIVTAPPPEEEKLPFAPALATSLAVAEMDPRADVDPQQELFPSESGPSA